MGANWPYFTTDQCQTVATTATTRLKKKVQPDWLVLASRLELSACAGNKSAKRQDQFCNNSDFESTNQTRELQGSKQQQRPKHTTKSAELERRLAPTNCIRRRLLVQTATGGCGKQEIGIVMHPTAGQFNTTIFQVKGSVRNINSINNKLQIVCAKMATKTRERQRLATLVGNNNAARRSLLIALVATFVLSSSLLSSFPMVAGYEHHHGHGHEHHHKKHHHHHEAPVVKVIHKTVHIPKAIPVPKYIPVPKIIPVPKTVAVPHPVHISVKVPIYKTVKKVIPVPKKMPVHKPYPVPKPYAVAVPVPVIKHHPYPVYKHVPVHKPYGVPVPYKVHKHVPVGIPKVVHVPKPYPVPYKVPIYKEVIVKKPVEVPVPVYIKKKPVYHAPTYKKHYHHKEHHHGHHHHGHHAAASNNHFSTGQQQQSMATAASDQASGASTGNYANYYGTNGNQGQYLQQSGQQQHYYQPQQFQQQQQQQQQMMTAASHLDLAGSPSSTSTGFSTGSSGSSGSSSVGLASSNLNSDSDRQSSPVRSAGSGASSSLQQTNSAQASDLISQSSSLSMINQYQPAGSSSAVVSGAAGGAAPPPPSSGINLNGAALIYSGQPSSSALAIQHHNGDISKLFAQFQPSSQGASSAYLATPGGLGGNQPEASSGDSLAASANTRYVQASDLEPQFATTNNNNNNFHFGSVEQFRADSQPDWNQQSLATQQQQQTQQQQSQQQQPQPLQKSGLLSSLRGLWSMVGKQDKSGQSSLLPATIAYGSASKPAAQIGTNSIASGTNGGPAASAAGARQQQLTQYQLHQANGGPLAATAATLGQGGESNLPSSTGYTG